MGGRLAPTAAAGIAESLQERLQPLAVGIDQWLAEAAEFLGDGLVNIPAFVLALVVGLAVWRGRAPVAGVVAALATQVLVGNHAWPPTAVTLGASFVVAVLAWPLAALVAATHVRLRERLSAPAPPLVVAVPVVAALALVGLLLGAVGFEQSFLLGAIGSAGLVSGELNAVGTSARWPLPSPAAHLLGTYVVVLVAEVLSGEGVGGVLARSIPTGEGRAFVGGLTAAVMVLLALAAAGSTERRVRPIRATSHTVAPDTDATREEQSA